MLMFCRVPALVGRGERGQGGSVGDMAPACILPAASPAPRLRVSAWGRVLLLTKAPKFGCAQP